MPFRFGKIVLAVKGTAKSLVQAVMAEAITAAGLVVVPVNKRILLTNTTAKGKLSAHVPNIAVVALAAVAERPPVHPAPDVAKYAVKIAKVMENLRLPAMYKPLTTQLIKSAPTPPLPKAR